MYAVLGIWSMDPARREEQDRGLYQLIIPSVRSHPGFLSGYWMRDQETGKSHSTVVLDTESSAVRLKETILRNAQNQAKAGITNDSLAVVEVIAKAQQ